MAIVEYKKQGHLVTITLNRPDKLNALNDDMLKALRHCWKKYQHDDDAWLAILTGTGKAFSAGTDKDQFVKALKGEDSLGNFLTNIGKDPYWSGTLNKPTITAINGAAIGSGLELVLKSDLRIAAESALFQQPEVGLGNIVIFNDNLPDAIAAEMLCGFPFSARRAYAVGMINRVVRDEQLMNATLDLADDLLSKPPLVLQQALNILRDLKNAGTTIPRHLLNQYTTEISKSLTKTEDWKEAVNSLVEKKKPVFKRR